MKATADDIPSLVRMRIAYTKEDNGAVSESDKAKMDTLLPDYFRRHLNHDLFAFVEKIDQEIIATALLLVIEKPSSPHFINGKIGNVLNVYTVPEYRHRGISTKLMKELIADGNELGLDYFELLATGNGYPLYKKLGFTEHTSSYTAMRYYP